MVNARNFRVLACFLSLLLILSPLSAFAAQSKYIEAGLNIQEMYDSNIFYSSTNRRSDYLTTLIPHVGLKRSLKKLRFEANADPQFLIYAKNSDINATNYRINEKIEADINSNLKASVANSNIKDNYSYIIEDPTNSISVGSTGRFEYEMNSVTPTISYTSDHGTSLTGTYTFDRTSYKSADVSDTDGHSLFAVLIHKISNFISFLADVNFQNRHYDSGFETSILLYDGGIRWTPTIRWTHDAKVGLQNIKQTGANSDSQFYYAYSVSYLISRLLSVTYLSQLSHSIIDTQNNILRIWQNTVTTTYKLTHRDSLNGSVSYVLSQIPSIKGDIVIVQADANLEHMLSRYVALKIGFKHEGQSSDISTKYKRDTAYVSFNLKY